MDIMTQYRVEAREALSRSEDEQSNRTTRVIASGDHVARGRLGRSQEACRDQRRKLSRGVHDILPRHARPTGRPQL